MKDRLYFDEYTLRNGMVVYHQPYDHPFVSMEVMLPVGHSHCTGDIIPGTFHFIEHTLAARSKTFPERRGFMNWLDDRAGEFDAGTSPDFTRYQILVPGEISKGSAEMLIQHVFEPEILEEDLRLDRAVFPNEDKTYPWYPGTDELSHYLRTEWADDNPTPNRLRFGTEEDLKNVTVEYLQAIHTRTYLNSANRIVVVGNMDIDAVCRKLESYPTHAVSLPSEVREVKWLKKAFHVKPFRDVELYEYRIAGLFNERLSLEMGEGLQLLQTLLTNISKGPLFTWLRDTYACYNTHSSAGFNRNDAYWSIVCPLNSMEQVEEIRKALPKKILEGVSDQSKIDIAIQRKVKRLPLYDETLRDVARTSADSIENLDRIVTHAEYRDILERFHDSQKVMEIYNKFFAPEHAGEFCAIPFE